MVAVGDRVVAVGARRADQVGVVARVESPDRGRYQRVLIRWDDSGHTVRIWVSRLVPVKDARLVPGAGDGLGRWLYRRR